MTRPRPSSWRLFDGRLLPERSPQFRNPNAAQILKRRIIKRRRPRRITRIPGWHINHHSLTCPSKQNTISVAKVPLRREALARLAQGTYCKSVHRNATRDLFPVRITLLVRRQTNTLSLLTRDQRISGACANICGPPARDNVSAACLTLTSYAYRLNGMQRISSLRPGRRRALLQECGPERWCFGCLSEAPPAIDLRV